MKRIYLLAVFLIFALMISLPVTAGQKSIDGKWSGVASSPPDPDILFSIVFETENGKLHGKIDVPATGLYEVELINLSFDGKTLMFSVPTPEGDVEASAKPTDEDTFSGTYDQMGVTGTFKMSRAK